MVSMRYMGGDVQYLQRKGIHSKTWNTPNTTKRGRPWPELGQVVIHRQSERGEREILEQLQSFCVSNKIADLRLHNQNVFFLSIQPFDDSVPVLQLV